MQIPENNIDINVISTKDQNFAYGKFDSRVRSQEITLKMSAPNSVLFTISKLKADDEGAYECVAENYEDDYDGTYSAKITVKGKVKFGGPEMLMGIYVFENRSPKELAIFN